MMYIGSGTTEVGPVNGETIQARMTLMPSAGAQYVKITFPLGEDKVVSIGDTIKVNINGEKIEFQVNAALRELAGVMYRVTIEASRPLKQEAS